VEQLRFEPDGKQLAAVDDGSGSADRAQAYVWELHGTAGRPLREELARIAALGGAAAVLGGPAAGPAVESAELTTDASAEPEAAPPQPPASPPRPPPPAEPAQRAPTFLEMHAMLGAGAQERRREELERRARELSEEARALAGRKEWTAALERLQELERMLDPADPRGMSHCLGFQGWILAVLGRQADTVAVLGREEALLRAAGDGGSLADGLLRHAELLLMVGEHGRARGLAEEAASLYAAQDREQEELKARAVALKARMGRPTPLKALLAFALALAPAGLGVFLGTRAAWLWVIGGPLVLLSVLLLLFSFSPGLRRKLQRSVES
jgi:hypothetical protein